ncbi:ATPase [Brucella endophytica]|uniref:histidine kinase n=1 Tax=Brucella endophytica TaxID=1963359 RepID=A0A916SNX7_9HYPH|nr:ATP-binding protein [Brucella endophytica]GGB08821.1 ATPase [Brucella endophytica]
MFDSLCRRWAPSGDAALRRMIAVFWAMPFALLAAFVVSGAVKGPLEAGLAFAIFAGVAMILSALASLSPRPWLVALAGLAVYGGGLGLAGFNAAANPALWVMAAAIPFECWFVARTARSMNAGFVVSALVLAAFLASVHAAPAASMTMAAGLTFAYAASLLIRAMTILGSKAEKAAPASDSDIESAIDGVVIRLSPDGVVQSLSPQAPDVFGVPRQVMQGTQLLDRVHVSDRVQYMALLADLREHGRAADVEVRLRRVDVDPETGVRSVAFRPFRINAVAAPAGFTLIARDISLEEATREALQKAREEAESLELARTRFLAATSHELRTPLNSIIGFSDALLHEMPCRFQNETQREYVGLIHQAGTHLLDVVNAILEMSKLESGAYSIFPEAFPFREAVDLCCGVMGRQAAQKGVILGERINAHIGDLVADRRAVQQILFNLVSNAVKFTDKGGCVTIDAGVQDMRGQRMLVFSVSDTGIGMAADDLVRLCRPFTQLDNAYTRAHEGTGLGLSLVKGLVDLHEGTMEIASRQGEGTIVTVRLPLDGPLSHRNQNQKEQAGTVIDIHRIQAERRHEASENDSQGEVYAQTRKTA